MIKLLMLMIFAYIVGGIPFAYILVKLKTGKDIRTIGSGNVGGTNAARAAGIHIGLLVGLLDMLKGALPTYIALKVCGADAAVLVGVTAVIGHMFTPFLSFQGGKGVATGTGAFLVLAPDAVAVGAVIWLIITAIFRFVSLGSMMAAVGMAVYVILFKDIPMLWVASIALALLIIVRHRSNIRRLLKGEEPKFKFRQ
ncbi:MAG: acyl-phosphate glycerol 3-phosphate acyltransferase [Candidatus Hydrothermota bacterium]|nr:MAG: acyl-phosphate glycerol 3-phosphate acyltransferase [Candidatus Hydrothermae bacterium]